MGNGGVGPGPRGLGRNTWNTDTLTCRRWPTFWLLPKISFVFSLVHVIRPFLQLQDRNQRIVKFNFFLLIERKFTHNIFHKYVSLIQYRQQLKRKDHVLMFQMRKRDEQNDCRFPFLSFRMIITTAPPHP